MSILLVATVIVACVFVFAPRAAIVTEVGIDAPPAQAWALLGDPESYRDWNPFIVSLQGELAEGARLTATMRPQAGREMTFRPTVLKVAPERELRWRGRLLLPRILDGEHYFLLEQRDGGTRLVHGERFRGLLLWFIDARQFRADFDRMNMALKARLEIGAGQEIRAPI
ncbi:SRPBCC domain-containing protein [Paenirhodobacter populi]|uniref:SRPBCC domain-containing protein n=1 Tax=Paenirhodobacter populi TaxID=2306993 RepID=A0A443JL95_9RHOB|nr:SRPBCC domain-containing protein [Sinirhodobacter populi]RWR21417.1 SRPBCC domain-containing protein [Sinirhodobacter populi]